MNLGGAVIGIFLCTAVGLVSCQTTDFCRVAAICGDGLDFKEVALNFTEISGNNAGVTLDVLNQVTDQLSLQFQASINSLQEQLSQIQQEQAKQNECPWQSYSGFVQSTDFVKHRGYFPKMNQFHMCGWINYVQDGSARNRSILSYAVGDQPADLLWQVQSETETRVRIGSNSVVFADHASLSGNHFVCVGYDDQKTVSLSIDGSQVATTNTEAQQTIPEGGTLVLGKYHPNSLGSAEYSETFGSGTIGNLMIWSRALTEEEQSETAISCNCPRDYVISFQHDQVERHGDTQYTVPQVCPRVQPSSAFDVIVVE